MTKILAIDPGLTMAWACVEDGQIIDVGTEHFELPMDEAPVDLFPEVTAAAFDAMSKLVDRLEPDIIQVELPDLGTKAIPTFVGLAMLMAVREREGVGDVIPAWKNGWMEKAKQVPLEFGRDNVHIRDAIAHALHTDDMHRKLGRQSHLKLVKT